MKKLLKFLISKIKYIVLIYLAIQLTIILSSDINYKSDSLYYYKLAQECLEQGEFYPTHIHLNEDYIFAPLYINVLIVLLGISNSPLTIALFNFLIVSLQILILYKISLLIFSKNIARISILLYIFYLNNLGFILLNYTELLFVLLISLSLYLFLMGKNYYLILSGITLGASIAVRPTGFALLLAFIILQIYNIYKNRKFVVNYLYIYTGVIVFILFFGGWTYSNFGKFEFMSTNGPVNLLIGANENATGGFKAAVFGEGNPGFIENSESLTYIQKNDFYRKQAISWIEEHPLKWLTLAPLKLLHAFGWDDITVSSLLGFNQLNFGRALKILVTGENLSNEFENKSAIKIVFYFSLQFLHHIYYFLILTAIVLGIFHLMKSKLSNDGVRLILFYSLISMFIIMIIFGSPRFKYPMFILLLPFAADYLAYKFKLMESRG